MHNRTVTVLVLLTAAGAALAASVGIWSDGGPGAYDIQSVRGLTVPIHGKGVYHHMSAEVAPQGIAQDCVTFFAAVPLLLLALLYARRGTLRGRLLLTGVLGYFLVTYLFYLMMAMYNVLFLLYVLLLSTAFFSFTLMLLSFDVPGLPSRFRADTPVRSAGGFLLFSALAIALLWLSIVVPPLLDGSIIPLQTEHYTTLVVQGLDLGLLLPAAAVAGVSFIRKKPVGFLLAPVYLVFLSVLMTALTAKVIAMALLGFNVIPVIFIIPSFALAAIVFSLLVLRAAASSSNRD